MRIYYGVERRQAAASECDADGDDECQNAADDQGDAVQHASD